MTARERMVAGELYDSLDPELVEARERARQLLARYNATGDREALTALFGRLADDAVVEAPFRCDYGFNISVGRRFYANVNCVFLDCAPIEIGDRVLFGPAAQLYAATHPIDAESRSDGLECALPITIGHDVWIGGAAIVLPGVTIGDRAV